MKFFIAETFEYKKRQLNPYISNKEKINSTINEAIPLTNLALLNTLPVEAAAGLYGLTQSKKQGGIIKAQNGVLLTQKKPNTNFSIAPEKYSTNIKPKTPVKINGSSFGVSNKQYYQPKNVKEYYFQNVKPIIDKIETNPYLSSIAHGLSSGIPGVAYGAINSYFYKPDFDARKAKTQDEAYKMARSTGAKTFIWNGKHFNTDYKGNPNKTLVQQKQEELDTYGITNEQTQNKNLITERLHNNLTPFGYEDAIKRVISTVILNKKENTSSSNKRNDAFSMLLGYPQKYNSFKISNYKPKNGKDDYYYALKEFAVDINDLDKNKWNSYEELKNKIYDSKIESDKLYNEYKKSKTRTEAEADSLWNEAIRKEHYSYLESMNLPKLTSNNLVNSIPNDKNISEIILGKGNVLGEYTVGKTKDYLSYYDKWDINPFGSGNDKPLYKLGKPLNIYDRKYFKK